MTRIGWNPKYFEFCGMARVLLIFRFSWPYVRKHRWRLYGALLAGAIFGLSNAGVLWLTRTVLERLNPEDAAGQELVSNDARSSDASFFQRSFPRTAAAESMAGSAKASVAEVVDRWFPKMGSPVTVFQLLGALLGLPLLVSIRSGGEYLSAYWMSWVGERMVNDLRVEVLETLSRLSLNYFNQAKMGDMITRINGDTLALQNCISIGVKHSVTDPVTILAVFAYLVFTDWQLMISTALLLPVCLVPVILYGRKARRASTDKIQTNVTQSSLIVEMLSAIRVVKAFALEEREVARFRRLSKRLFGYTMRGVRSQEIVGPIIETVSMAAVGMLIVFVVETERSAPDLITFFIGLIMFYMPIKKLAKLHVFFEQASVSVGRLQNILAETPEVQDSPQAASIQTFSKSIQFENVSFVYHRATPSNMALQNIRLTIPHGQKLGIAGESGSGKSTLIHLLFRFFDPTTGAVLFDGKDLRTLKVKDCRKLLSLVSQDIVVFDQSVAENIRCGRLNATKKEIIQAARQAHAIEFIEKLKKGFETRLGERGATLSGGQRQRIAIARAFVRNAPILVLDEATAALDAQSEAEVQTAIDKLAQNRTVICIAHRLSTLRAMDKIIVLQKGRIAEQGAYPQLLSQNGPFARMGQRQGIQTKAQ